MTTPPAFAAVAALEFEIDTVSVKSHDFATADGAWSRLTTEVVLRGRGCEGCGEDVTYSNDDQLSGRTLIPELPLTGTWTIERFSSALDALELYGPTGAASAAQDMYRRWALESAALDLALRQHGTSL